MFNNTNLHKTFRQRSKVTHISNFFFFNQTHSFYSAQKHFETHIKQFCYMKFEAYKIRRVQMTQSNFYKHFSHFIPKNSYIVIILPSRALHSFV